MSIAAAPSNLFTIVGHDLIGSRGEATGLKTMRMTAGELMDYARVAYATVKKSKEEFLHARVRLGVFLLQAHAQIRYGGWRDWLKATNVHYRTAVRCMNLASVVADSKGECDTSRLVKLLTAYKTGVAFRADNESRTDAGRMAVRVEPSDVSVHQVELAMGWRKPRKTTPIEPPIGDAARAAFSAVGFVPPKSVPFQPVVVDGRAVQTRPASAVLSRVSAGSPFPRVASETMEPAPGRRSLVTNGSKPSYIDSLCSALRRVTYCLDLLKVSPSEQHAAAYQRVTEEFERHVRQIQTA